MSNGKGRNFRASAGSTIGIFREYSCIFGVHNYLRKVYILCTLWTNCSSILLSMAEPSICFQLHYFSMTTSTLRPPLLRSNIRKMYKGFANFRGAPKREGLLGYSLQIEIKKYPFTHDDVQHFVSYSFHPTLVNERGLWILKNIIKSYGPGSSVGIATVYCLAGPRSNTGGEEIFHRYRTALGPI